MNADIPCSRAYALPGLLTCHLATEHLNAPSSACQEGQGAFQEAIREALEDEA